MITDEQKKEIKRLANFKKYEIRKSRYIEKSLESMFLLEKFDDDFDITKYKKIKRYTEE